MPEDHGQLHPDAAPVLKTIGGQELKQLFAASTTWLERHTAYINSLNVFPVPDGDSGTNMLLTMQAALKEVNSSPNHSAHAICAALSHGALLGARGNSGVILSQIVRGFSRAIDKRETINAHDFAIAMAEGSRTAYKGVVKPVEGTILTVCRDAADGAAAAAARSDDLRRVVAATVDAARASVVRTPQLLPVLKEAGVVDAGGQGLLVILEGALKYLRGEPIELSTATGAPTGLENLVREEGWGFDIQFHIRGSTMDVEDIREKISAMGESTLVVGDPHLIKVHVHAPTPGAILDYGCSVGTITNVIVENMQEQYIDFMGSQKEENAKPEVSMTGISTIAVAPGAGLSRVFQSLGVSAIVSGGQTMNPSTEEILRAIESTQTSQVLVLPNNKNIIPAAQQAQAISKKHVSIIPTKTIPQGIAALLAFNFQNDLEANTKAMTRAISSIETAEITVATRSASLDGIQVKQGQTIGLIDGTLHAAGDDPNTITLQLLGQMHTPEREIITIYFGDGMTETDAQNLARSIKDKFPSQEIEIVNGGQPHYSYIISVE